MRLQARRLLSMQQQLIQQTCHCVCLPARKAAPSVMLHLVEPLQCVELRCQVEIGIAPDRAPYEGKFKSEPGAELRCLRGTQCKYQIAHSNGLTPELSRAEGVGLND